MVPARMPSKEVVMLNDHVGFNACLHTVSSVDAEDVKTVEEHEGVCKYNQLLSRLRHTNTIDTVS